MRKFIQALLLSAVGVLVVACSQSEGEVCQQDSDCSSGLICQKGKASEVRGTCRDPNRLEVEMDAGGETGPVLKDASSDDGDGGASVIDDDGGAPAVSTMDSGTSALPDAAPVLDAAASGDAG